MRSMPTGPDRLRACDEVLWLDCKKGDRDAFAVLYRRYFKILIQTSIAICQDKDLIKDCVHDLFADIWKNKSTLGVPISVKAYLVRSIQRKILRQLKRSRAGICQYETDKIPDTEMVPCIEKKIITEQFRREQRSDILKAIKVLTKRQQQAVYLKFYTNLSYTEIAGKMAISTDSIYNLISKAIGNMHQELAKMPMHKL